MPDEKNEKKNDCPVLKTPCVKDNCAWWVGVVSSTIGGKVLGSCAVVGIVNNLAFIAQQNNDEISKELSRKMIQIIK